MELKYHIIKKENYSIENRRIFSDLLKKQGKVTGKIEGKIDKCKIICIVKNRNTAVGIGGIKRKTGSVFLKDKANVPDLKDKIKWELGYIYVEPEVRGQGVASQIVKELIKISECNILMATTEVEHNPGMIKILDENGFIRYGQEWKSIIHDNMLGLFIKYDV